MLGTPHALVPSVHGRQRDDDDDGAVAGSAPAKAAAASSDEALAARRQTQTQTHILGDPTLGLRRSGATSGDGGSVVSGMRFTESPPLLRPATSDVHDKYIASLECIMRLTTAMRHKDAELARLSCDLDSVRREMRGLRAEARRSRRHGMWRYGCVDGVPAAEASGEDEDGDMEVLFGGQQEVGVSLPFSKKRRHSPMRRPSHEASLDADLGDARNVHSSAGAKSRNRSQARALSFPHRRNASKSFKKGRAPGKTLHKIRFGAMKNRPWNSGRFIAMKNAVGAADPRKRSSSETPARGLPIRRSGNRPEPLCELLFRDFADLKDTYQIRGKDCVTWQSVLATHFPSIWSGLCDKKKANHLVREYLSPRIFTSDEVARMRRNLNGQFCYLLPKAEIEGFVEWVRPRAKSLVEGHQQWSIECDDDDEEDRYNAEEDNYIGGMRIEDIRRDLEALDAARAYCKEKRDNDDACINNIDEEDALSLGDDNDDVAAERREDCFNGPDVTGEESISLSLSSPERQEDRISDCHDSDRSRGRADDSNKFEVTAPAIIVEFDSSSQKRLVSPDKDADPSHHATAEASENSSNHIDEMVSSPPRMHSVAWAAFPSPTLNCSVLRFGSDGLLMRPAASVGFSFGMEKRVGVDEELESAQS